MENLVQQEIIRAIVNARNKGENIKQLIKVLAREFTLTESMVKGIIEFSASYGLERVNETGSKNEGKLWKPLDYMKAIKRLEDIIYELRAEVVRLHNRMNRELGFRESPWAKRRPSSLEAEEEPLEPQEDEEIPRRQILLKAHEKVDERRERIQELRGVVDKARDRLNGREEGESPSLTFRDLQEIER